MNVVVDTSYGLIGELEKPGEIKLDENLQDLFPDAEKVFKQAVEDNISLKKKEDESASLNFEIRKEKIVAKRL